MAKKKKWPKTIEEAVDKLISVISEEDKCTIKATKKEDLISFHFSLGMYIRNEFGLWGDNKELLRDCGLRAYPDSPYDDYILMLIHPDSASTEIIEALWEKLQRE